ncbi:serine/threonine protein kinase [Actinomadura barringtoniae]|uniref:Serine/threonine protein kinase n=1 Tax=Actinomadura barringtoniae TaxID=1427535 RepID=A0A939PQT5_9ACTN|nr:serine/threonine-protein kinase [Actinomadura barringtoniae]MBO2454469.1 serine/threonine protein kinase [Actinomadura barringtoniae]
MPGWVELQPEDPRAIGPFTIVGRIGIGGQGTVYAATGTEADDTTVAVKLLHAHLSFEEKARTRFLREVEAAKAVEGSCTVQVVGSGVQSQRPYIVTQYVDGPSLQESVAADGAHTGEALERLALSTATALAAIHRADIVHRDFKPANVLLGPDGPVVIDFGIARALTSSFSTTSQVVGSPSYMAPEQISNDPIGPPADLFAWGLTMAYAANGAKAFTAETIPGIMQAILTGAPDLGDLTGRLRTIVERCLAKDPADRPTAEQVVAELQAKPNDLGSLTMPSARKVRHVRRPVVITAVAAGVVLALCGVLATDLITSSGHDDKNKADGPHPESVTTSSAAAAGIAPASPSASPSRKTTEQSTPSTSGGPTPGSSSSPKSSDKPSPGKSSSRPKSSHKPSTPKGTTIGTMPYTVVDPYCRSRGYASGTTLANGPFCVTKSNQFVPVNMDSVCRWKFPAYPNARILSYNSVGGWTCLSS